MKLTCFAQFRLAVIFLPALLQGGARADDWPQFQGPGRNAVSAEKGLISSFDGESGPAVLWRVGLNEGFGGAAIADGKVYVMDRLPGEADVLLCLDLETGRELWRYSQRVTGRLSFPGSRNTPTVEGDHVYMIGGFGHVSCLQRESGKLVWSLAIMEEFGVETPPNWGYAQSPLLVGEVLVACVLSEKVGLVGLDKRSGRILWKSRPLGSTMSQPAYFELQGVPQVVLLSTLDRDARKGLLAGCAIDDGRILWSNDLYYNRFPIPVPVLVGEDRMLLTGGYECGSVLLGLEGSGEDIRMREIYRIKGGSQLHAPQLVGDHLFIMLNENANYKTRMQREESGGLACLRIADGREVWRTGNEPYFGRGSMILADGKLIIQDGHNGILRMVDPSSEGYRLLGEANVFDIAEGDLDHDHQFWSPLALSDGRLVMRGQKQMICVDLRG
jgi:outer membrane protein assembly factor BamB